MREGGRCVLTGGSQGEGWASSSTGRRVSNQAWASTLLEVSFVEWGASSAGLEQEDSNLSEVEVDEVLGLVGHVRTEVAAHNAVPCRVVPVGERGGG